MCTYLTTTAPVRGSSKSGDDWHVISRAVVYFDHPQHAPFDHALCIDFTAGEAPGRRVAVELDATSARVLAETIIATLDSPEAMLARD